MKACSIPKSMKKGSVFYSFNGVSFTDGTSSVEAHEWVVRSIQNKPTKLNLGGTCLSDYSRMAVIINLVSKKKDVTWLGGEWASYIPKNCQIKFEQDERLPDGVYTTQLQAIKFAVEEKKSAIAETQKELSKSTSKNDVELWGEELAFEQKELKLLKGRLTRTKNLKAKSK